MAQITKTPGAMSGGLKGVLLIGGNLESDSNIPEARKPLHVRRLRCRFGLSQAHAAAVCDLAGLGGAHV